MNIMMIAAASQGSRSDLPLHAGMPLTLFLGVAGVMLLAIAARTVFQSSQRAI